MPRLVAIKDGKISRLAFGVNEDPSRAEIDQALIDEWSAGNVQTILISDPSLRAEPGDIWNGTEGVDPRTLPEQKVGRRQEIDQRTSEIISTGFEYPASSGQRFSLSLEAQMNLEVATRACDSGNIVFPVIFSLKDGSGAFECPDAATLQGMWAAALAHKRGALDSGNALKAAINAATTEAELAAVADTR